MELTLTPTDHLSPPSTTSRLSDSDTSECDLEDGLSGVGIRERRIADGASISSVGSSSRYIGTNHIYVDMICKHTLSTICILCYITSTHDTVL
jgi:hypothetical protein